MAAGVARRRISTSRLERRQAERELRRRVEADVVVGRARRVGRGAIEAAVRARSIVIFVPRPGLGSIAAGVGRA